MSFSDHRPETERERRDRETNELKEFLKLSHWLLAEGPRLRRGEITEESLRPLAHQVNHAMWDAEKTINCRYWRDVYNTRPKTDSLRQLLDEVLIMKARIKKPIRTVLDSACM
ncbi:Oidioi.mRNA.OKI2018_I69.YSR.g17089.t1.cds [Oikopleura dioica]|uniref:Oidioi.mRNA.OKI2018_I69.YSR.g17089.t1.cds n=1 Tax=Oikopleura dioica TaxID=34765 RepID=A0ABN7SJX3_OIKDI|nr:Oidioi.mRNA.OKI2018_I69.YSR.g17089.t1.cds [Oikopleura dioica]